MTLQEIIDRLHLTILTDPADFSQCSPSSGYASDLLSCVMASAKSNGLWVTLQCHGNIVAVAALLELCAVIITEGALPDPAAITKANEQNITLLSTSQPSFAVAGMLWELGLREK